MSVTINGNGTVTGLTALPATAMASKSAVQFKSAIKTNTQAINGNGGGSNGDDVDISGLSFTITPSSTSSLVFLQASIVATVGQNNQMGFKIKANNSVITAALGDASSSKMRNTASALYNMHVVSDWTLGNTTFAFAHAPATTSAVTYKICLNMATNDNTSYINRSIRDYDGTNYDYRTISTFIGMEITA